MKGLASRRMEGARWLCTVVGVVKKRFMDGVWPMEIAEDSASATASEKGCVWKLEVIWVVVCW